MGRNTRILVVLTAFVLVVAAGCGDDDDGGLFDDATPTSEASSTSTMAATTTTSDEASTTSTAADEPTTTAAPADDDGTPGGAEDIEELLERYRSEPLRLTYELGVDGSEGVLIISQDPDRDPPVSAFIFPDDGGKMIQRGDEMIICDASSCFAMPAVGGQEMLMAFFGGGAAGALLAADLTDVAGIDVDTEEATIGGRSGVCFTLSPEAMLDPNVEYVRQCVDADLGFVLLMEVKERDAAQPEQAMTLIDFGAPTPEDFEPTGPIEGVPTP